MSENEPAEGWTWLANSNRQHYFVNGFSLCNRWMTFSKDDFTSEPQDDAFPCKTCHKAWLKRKAAAK